MNKEKEVEHPIIKWAKEIADRIVRKAEEYAQQYLSEDYINKLYREMLEEEERKLREDIEKTIKFFDDNIRKLKSISKEEIEKIADEIVEEVIKV